MKARRLTAAAVLAAATVSLGGPSPHADTGPPPPVFVIGALHMNFVPGETGLAPSPVPARLQQGGRLFFANTDPDAPHVLSSEEGPDGTYRFHTEGGPVQFGDVREVLGASRLPVGSHRYICQIHPDLMWGTLVIHPPA